ncbi:YfcE family phosphodiesterase [Thiocapsa imhoffii]|uniref:Phosphoesterase n=1 Tax=Thiocapsa imhoffii TaxID=382777 RepID=A0A9X1BA08_9GAMM|nr:metallophosphoesterase family protein [Thiocapsa imhoffii]MBK1645591.1 YfcE family phosphodiesterase [Thiocapsa imhoffii]
MRALASGQAVRIPGRSLRVALLSDTHGVLDARVDEVVRDCDLAVHGGDIGSAGVLARLRPRLGHVLAVFGNNDVATKWPLPDRELLCELPQWLDISLPGGQLIVIHGHQSAARDRHRRLRERFPSARAILYGHSHRLVVDQTAAPWILNPGAAGRTRTGGGPSCLVLSATIADWSVAVHRFPLPARHPRSPRTRSGETAPTEVSAHARS